MSSNYKLVSMDEDEREQLLPSEEKVKCSNCCTPSRFTIITLSGLVFLLIAALFCLIRWPPGGPACDNARKTGAGVVRPGPQDTVLGLITDIHLTLHPEECAGKNASVYGVFGCDPPVGLLNVTLSDMAVNLHRHGSHQRALVLLGDAAQHQPDATWDYKVTLSSIKAVFKQFELQFPSTSVFPTIGNNDLPAHNSVPDIGWYSSMLQIFEPAIKRGPGVTVPANFREIFMYGGYYSANLADKFTVISLNTNLFSASVKDRTSQHGYAVSHLQWLNDTLNALPSTARALIIGHHPPTLSLYNLYAKTIAKNFWRLEHFEKFREIFRRHHVKIMGMFFGHEHQNTVVVERTSEVEMGSFTLPSVSPIYSGQPSYGIAVIKETKDGKKIKDFFTFHTWLDYYTRLKKEPKFFTYQSLGEIFKIDELTHEGMYGKIQNIIDESDEMKTIVALKERIYQRRFVPIINTHLYYCYSTNFNVAAFIQCVEKFGYNGKPYIVNS